MPIFSLLVLSAILSFSQEPRGLEEVDVYRSGLRSVTAFAALRADIFPAEKLAEPRLLGRDEKGSAHDAWRALLDYLLALDALGKSHEDFWKLKGPARELSLAARYGAFLAQYRFATDFIARVENDPGLGVLFDEPVAELGLPKGAYSKLKLRFLHVGRAAEFAALSAIYKSLSKSRRAGIEEDEEALWKLGKGRGEALTAKNGLKILKQAGFSAWFPVQAGVSEWMGDVKVARRGRSLISQEQISALLTKLEPGDVLLERREWFLSNIGLPGYWPHAALYVGTPQERKAYFGDDLLEAELALKRPQAYQASLGGEGAHPFRVLEAMSEGVVFTTLEHSADADAVAVLRPRLPKKEKAEAILRAFQYQGRPYDFNFDFRTDEALVCTELIYKSYQPAKGFRGLRLPIEQLMGRLAMPANLMARQFDLQYGTTDQQTDLVVFLDGVEKEKKAVENTPDAFRRSWMRPKWHILTQ